MDHTGKVFAINSFMNTGFLVIFFGRMTGEDNGQYGKLLTNYQLNTYTRKNCVNAVRSKLTQAFSIDISEYPASHDPVAWVEKH